MIPTDIHSQLIRDEGMRKFPYPDAKGKTTIGVGRNLTDKGLSDVEVQFLLANDITETTDALAAAFPWFPGLDGPRQGVLINMAFNMGIEGLSGFAKFLAAVMRHDWDAAADEMGASLWAGQVGDRAVRLSSQMRTGAWV
jgi:lysozyme